MRFLVLAATFFFCSAPIEGVVSGSQKQSREGESACGPSGLRLTIQSDKTEYLVGEPVKLTVSFSNGKKEVVSALTTDLKYDIHIRISSGNQFERYDFGLQKSQKVARSTKPLRPGNVEKYYFRLLYSYFFRQESRNRLAFPKPGKYAIEARYPVWPGREFIESDRIHVKIKRPKGDDAKLWQTLNEPAILRFMQSGELWADEEDIPVKIAGRLERFPKSAYANALTRALKRYYHETERGMTKQAVKNDPWMKRLRKLLDIPFKVEPRLFPNDDRLGVRIEHHFPTRTPLEDVFKVISKKGGVPLGLHDDLKVRSMSNLRQEQTLREFLERRSQYKAKWIKDGDGYKLVPAPQPDLHN